MVDISLKYLLADVGLGIIWLALILFYKKYRKEIYFGSIIYPVILVPLFIVSKILGSFMGATWRYVPDYFNPDSLFNLSRITGGLAIEDVLFMIFAGGIISVFYEIIFRKGVSVKYSKKHHLLAIIAFFVAYCIIAISFKFNPIYNLIISRVIGFFVMIIQRPDLFKHALFGALAFTLFYFIFGVIFVSIFPDTLINFWTFSNISGILVFNFPIEELLYAFSFGLLWAPIYEYVNGYRSK